MLANTEQNLLEYYETHNIYVQQLHACNAMIKLYQNEILPKLLEVCCVSKPNHYFFF